MYNNHNDTDFSIYEIAIILYRGNDIISYLLDTYTQCNGQIFTFQ